MTETYLQSSRIGLALELTSPNRRRAGPLVLFSVQRGTIESNSMKHHFLMLYHPNAAPKKTPGQRNN